MIYVKNKKKYSGNGFYIGRPSILGNPYTHLKGKTLAKFTVETRQKSVEKYREYFEEQMRTNYFFKRMIDIMIEKSKVEDIYLICWCKPLSCHGDIIKEYLERE